MAPDPLLQAIADVCRRAREDAGVKQVHIASRIDVDQSTIARFERAEGWPRNPHNVGVVVNAYAAELERDASELLKEAVDAWGEANRRAGEALALQAAQDAGQQQRSRRREAAERPHDRPRRAQGH